jgi:hypothetical protein
MRQLGLLVVLVVIALPTQADMRCSGRVIDHESVAELVQLCGQPVRIEKREDLVEIERYDVRRGVYYSDYIKEPYEVWTFNLGSGKFLRDVKIKHGRVQGISERGYAD